MSYDEYRIEEHTGICSYCGEECYTKELDLSIHYSGTHCTGGVSGAHYPRGHGEIVSDCCEAELLEVTP